MSTATFTLKDAGEEEDDEERRDHQEDVGEAHQERVNLPPNESCNDANKGADGDRANRGGEADEQRGTPAVSDERHHIELQHPGFAERTTPGWWPTVKVDHVRLRNNIEVVREQERPEHDKDEDADQDPKAGWSHARLHEALPRLKPRALRDWELILRGAAHRRILGSRAA